LTGDLFRVAIVLSVVILIFLAVIFVILFVFFLVRLLSMVEIGNDRLIRRIGARSMHPAHIQWYARIQTVSAQGWGCH
jgi:hypothetical protein